MNSPVVASRRLIVNADDYGLTAGVSRGILEAHLKGVVTSTSVMIGSPDIETSMREALTSAPRLGMGVHLTLSGDGTRPVLAPEQVPTLVQADGTFYPLEDWLRRFAGFDFDQIARELTAQVDRFVALAGRLPDHLDAHHHICYRHPIAFQTLVQLAHQYHIPIRNVGFGSDRASSAALNSLVENLSPDLQQSTLVGIRALLEQGDLSYPERFEDGFYDATATLGDLLLILANLPAGSVTELMCHPAYSDASLHNDYTEKRDVERGILTHTSVRELIAAEGIELITYDALPRS